VPEKKGKEVGKEADGEGDLQKKTGVDRRSWEKKVKIKDRFPDPKPMHVSGQQMTASGGDEKRPSTSKKDVKAEEPN